MPQFMITTEIKVATCPRCSGYVFKSHADGLAVIADPAPLADLAAYTGALLAGRRTFDLLEQAGRPWKLHTRTPASDPPAPNTGALRTPSGRPVLAEHSCAVLGADAVRFEEVVPTPPLAPVMPGGRSGGRHPRAASGSPGPTRATPVSRRLFRCEACRKIIRPAEAYVAIEWGRFAWARHTACARA